MTSALHRSRIDAVVTQLDRVGARSVLDLGCGEGDLLVALLAVPSVNRLLGIDISPEAVAVARQRIAASEAKKDMAVVEASIAAFVPPVSFDAAVLLEVIEHIEPGHLPRLERMVMDNIAPATIVVTTPNRDYNHMLGVPPHRFRHPDHRFEWGRERFRAWGERTARRYDYSVSFKDVPPGTARLGGPTQMAVFERSASFTCS